MTKSRRSDPSKDAMAAQPESLGSGELDPICDLDAVDVVSRGQTVLAGIRCVPGVTPGVTQTKTLTATKL